MEIYASLSIQRTRICAKQDRFQLYLQGDWLEEIPGPGESSTDWARVLRVRRSLVFRSLGPETKI
jgi:hypothetical protein